MQSGKSKLEKVALTLVLLMILLQGFYAVFAYIDTMNFANVRGTELFSQLDADWVMIYGSRTLFITLILSYLLFCRQYAILKWCALFGMVMPITDGILAYYAQAPISVITKHAATVAYLGLTFMVLRKLTAPVNH